MKKLSGGKNEKFSFYEKYICIFLFLVVPLFFTILYFLMTESYEDILHYSSDMNSDILKLLDGIYHYIPRLGEFYQRIATHFMSIQFSFGLDAIFRLLSVLMSWGLIYGITFLTLGRKIRMKYSDVLVYFAYFVIFMVSPISEIFTYRFSYIHNYILSALVTVTFLCFYRTKIEKVTLLKFVLILFLGFFFGISTEVSPIAFLMIVAGWLVVNLVQKKVSIASLFKKYKLQLVGACGVLLGLLFFYAGAGLGVRTGGTYAQIYDYVSPTLLFKSPSYLFFCLYKHFWYNIRYIAFFFPLLVIIFCSEVYLKRKKEIDEIKIENQIYCILFVVLSFGAGSLINIHDDLYVRFLSQPLMAMVIIFMIYIHQILILLELKNQTKLKIGIGTVILAILMLLDVSYAFSVYHIQVKADLDKIHPVHGGGPVVDKLDFLELKEMKPSPIFHWKQLTPYDWGKIHHYLKYGITIEDDHC